MNDMLQLMDAMDDVGDAMMAARYKAVGGTCGVCGSSGAQHPANADQPTGRCSWHCQDTNCQQYHPNK